MTSQDAIFWSVLSVIGMAVGVPMYKRFMARYRERMLNECKQGHMAIGKKIFHCWNASDMEGYVSEIKEWAETYSGRIERGMFNKLHDQLLKEWHERYYLVKPRMVG